MLVFGGAHDVILVSPLEGVSVQLWSRQRSFAAMHQQRVVSHCAQVPTDAPLAIEFPDLAGVVCLAVTPVCRQG